MTVRRTGSPEESNYVECIDHTTGQQVFNPSWLSNWGLKEVERMAASKDDRTGGKDDIEIIYTTKKQ